MNKSCPLCQGATKTYLDYRRIGKGDYQLLRCSSCKLVFTEPLPSPEFLQKFYQSYDSFGAQDNYYRDLKNYRETPAGRDLIKSFSDLAVRYKIEKGLAILDLGSGGGAFLDILKNGGYQAVGVEVSTSAAEFARKQFGVKVITGTAEGAALADSQFGAVFMLDLLEHVRLPSVVLKKTNQWLKHGGLLIIETPNNRALINKIILFLMHLNVTWPASWMFGYHHLYWFSKESLVKLLEANGFKLLEIKTGNTLAERIFPWSIKYFFPRLILEITNFFTKLLGAENKLLVVAQKT